MTIIVLLIGISLTIAMIFLVVFFWNMRHGQYDDTYTPSVRMLFDEKTRKEPIDPGGKKSAADRKANR
ncbi:MAG TPA: cbb3-type cytochrome oxidase assembly protein CcoS [Chryseosolibacter sp.]